MPGAYIAARQDAGAANATINRELAALKRAYTLATRATPPKLHAAPYIALLQEHNVRTGFFERDQFEAVRRHLPAALQPLVTVAYITGWRVTDELLPMRWSQVDLAAGTLRLEPGTTKNAEGRLFYMTPELRACLTAQKAATEHLQRTREAIIPFVFHRDGAPILYLYNAWDRACRAGRLPRPAVTRLPPHGRAEPRARRRLPAGRDGDGRPQDRELSIAATPSSARAIWWRPPRSWPSWTAAGTTSPTHRCKYQCKTAPNGASDARKSAISHTPTGASR